MTTTTMIQQHAQDKNDDDDNNNNNNNNHSCTNKKRSTTIYTFQEARRMARGHGFDSKEEFLDYDCPGAYQVPKDAESLYATEWKGWDDFLGIVYRDFEKARQVAQDLSLTTMEDYLAIFAKLKATTHDDDHPALRLPYRPDKKYASHWKGWDDWLGVEP